jgi:hypothetical protein
LNIAAAVVFLLIDRSMAAGSVSHRAAPVLRIGDVAAAERLRQLGGDESELIAAVMDTQAATRDRIAAAHRLSGRLAACCSRAEAVRMVRKVRSAALWDALCDLMMLGDALGALVLQLVQWLVLDADGCRDLNRSGTLAVLVGVLRAPDATLRGHGLPVLAIAAELPELVKPLARAGVIGLLHSLCGSRDADTWHWILAISDGLMRDPRSLPAQCRQPLTSILLRCPLNRAEGRTAAAASGLAASDAVILRRLLSELRVTKWVLSAQPPAEPDTAGSPTLPAAGLSAAQPQRVEMSASLARAAAAANAISAGGSSFAAPARVPRVMTVEERDRAWSLEEEIRRRSESAGITVVGREDRLVAAPSPPPVAPKVAW